MRKGIIKTCTIIGFSVSDRVKKKFCLFVACVCVMDSNSNETAIQLTMKSYAKWNARRNAHKNCADVINKPLKSCAHYAKISATTKYGFDVEWSPRLKTSPRKKNKPK